MPKVYSVDSILDNNRPYVEIRGKLYEVRDITVKERLAKINEFQERQAEAEAEAEEEGREVTFDDVQQVIARAIQTALVGVPDEVADSVTQREWEVIQKVLQDIRESELPITAEEVDSVDENLVMREV